MSEKISIICFAPKQWDLEVRVEDFGIIQLPVFVDKKFKCNPIKVKITIKELKGESMAHPSGTTKKGYYGKKRMEAEKKLKRTKTTHKR